MLHKRHRRVWFCLLALVLGTPVAVPQNNPVAEKPATRAAKPKATVTEGAQSDDQRADQKQDRRVIIENADDYRYDPATKMHYLRGHVVFVTRDMRMTCEAADYNADADTMKASGNLRATDNTSVITGDLLEADFGQERIVVTGNVTVIAQKKPNSQKVPSGGLVADLAVSKGPRKAHPALPDSRNPALETPTPQPPAGKQAAKAPPERLEDYSYKRTTITCERLEYFYGDDQKRMIATPRVKAVQDERTVFADEAVYEDIPRLVTLTGNVLVQAKNGDELRCNRAVVALDEDWVKAEKISGVTLRKARESDRAAGAEKGPTPAPTPATGPQSAPAESSARERPAPPPEP